MLFLFPPGIPISLALYPSHPPSKAARRPNNRAKVGPLLCAHWTAETNIDTFLSYPVMRNTPFDVIPFPEITSSIRKRGAKENISAREPIRHRT
jgi:hypothetical protein